MWTICCCLIDYTCGAFLLLSQKSLETSAVTNSIASSCANTNKAGVKHIYTHTHRRWGKKRSGLIWYSRYPPTMHSDRLTPPISHTFRQRLTATMWAWRPVMEAEAFRASVTVFGLCGTLPFAELKSVTQSELGVPVMLMTDCSIQGSFGTFSWTWTKK